MKKILLFLLFIAYFGFATSTEINAQVYGSNTFEFQYGNLPYEDNKDLSTSYDQLNLFYDSDKISFYGKLEQFISPFKDRNYLDLTQKRFQYEDDNFRVRVGNFYETIGRGLLLRSYDIPGSVYEDAFERTRYGFYRDLEGVAINANTSWLEIKALRAEPLFNLHPPNFEPDSLRRPDLVEAIQANIFINEMISIGGAFMRSNPSFTNDYQEYGSLMFDLNPVSNIQFFGEYAFQSDAALLAFNDEDSFALYSGVNFYLDSFGGSLEYKNYNNFRLGQGYNDPPSLIKEHTYPILNRSTHVLETSNETGFQAEVYYTFEGGHSITTNIATAKNELFSEANFREYFVEGYYVIDDYFSVKGFLDYAYDIKEPSDLITLNDDRVSLGFITEKSFSNEHSFMLDLQYQHITRVVDLKAANSKEEDKSGNFYGALTFSPQYDFTMSVIFEASTDPQLTDKPNTFEVETDTRTWFGANASYKVNSSNRIDVFAGKRRGGPACTSGICYEILDFEGVEVRFSTRF